MLIEKNGNDKIEEEMKLDQIDKIQIEEEELDKKPKILSFKVDI